jgi:hypothetical protein
MDVPPKYYYSHVYGDAWLTRRVPDWMIGFIDTLSTQLGTTGNYSAIAILRTFSSPLHTHLGSKSSLGVSCQRIYNSLSRQITYEVFFAQSNTFLAISSRSPSTANSRTRPNSRQLLKRPSFSLYNPSARTTQKTQPLYCWEGLFPDPLPSNGRTTVARVCFRGNVFTESLPSNGSIRHSIYIHDTQYHNPKTRRHDALGTCAFTFASFIKVCQASSERIWG